MKQHSRQSTSAHSSSVNNYDARKMATRLNESVVKAVEEAHQEEMLKNSEEEVTARLTVQFTSHWAQKEAALQQQLVAEKTTPRK